MVLTAPLHSTIWLYHNLSIPLLLEIKTVSNFSQFYNEYSLIYAFMVFLQNGPLKVRIPEPNITNSS